MVIIIIIGSRIIYKFVFVSLSLVSLKNSLLTLFKSYESRSCAACRNPGNAFNTQFGSMLLEGSMYAAKKTSNTCK
jgi:hypothetical protein